MEIEIMEKERNNHDMKTIILGVISCAVFFLLNLLFSQSLADWLKSSTNLHYSPLFIGGCLFVFVILLGFVVCLRCWSMDTLLLKTHNVLIALTKIFIVFFIVCAYYSVIALADSEVIAESTSGIKNQNIFGLLLFSLCIIIPCIVSEFLLSTLQSARSNCPMVHEVEPTAIENCPTAYEVEPPASSNCPMAHEVDELRKKNNCAVTATCIPFEWKSDANIIRTFLYLNPKYETQEWMFPGGHAFAESEEYWYPEDVAKHKAKREVGVDVVIISLDSEKEKETSDHVCKKKSTPHFVCHITQGEHAKCYREGHRYHYDCIYIGDITSRNSAEGTLDIEIPSNTSTFDEIKAIVLKKLENMPLAPEVQLRNVNYVSTMLFNAFVYYIEYKQKKFDEQLDSEDKKKEKTPPKKRNESKQINKN